MTQIRWPGWTCDRYSAICGSCPDTTPASGPSRRQLSLSASNESRRALSRLRRTSRCLSWCRFLRRRPAPAAPSRMPTSEKPAPEPKWLRLSLRNFAGSAYPHRIFAAAQYHGRSWIYRVGVHGRAGMDGIVGTSGITERRSHIPCPTSETPALSGSGRPSSRRQTNRRTSICVDWSSRFALRVDHAVK